MRFAAAAFALTLAAPAQAGGVGLLLNGGAHSENVYFYSSQNADGVEYSNLNDYEQFQLVEYIPNYGGGVELLLGDRDQRILGSFRVYYNQDAPQADPAGITTSVPTDADDAARSPRPPTRTACSANRPPSGGCRPGSPPAAAPASGRPRGGPGSRAAPAAEGATAP